MDGAAAHVVTFGTVAAIEGARARVVLDMAEDGSGFAGPVPPQIGQVVRVDVGEARVFGVIIGLRTPAAEQAIIGPPNQIMDLDLIGEILETSADARFRRGVSEFPRLGDRVSAAGSDDLRKIFTRTDREGVRVRVRVRLLPRAVDERAAGGRRLPGRGHGLDPFWAARLVGALIGALSAPSAR